MLLLLLVLLLGFVVSLLAVSQLVLFLVSCLLFSALPPPPLSSILICSGFDPPPLLLLFVFPGFWLNAMFVTTTKKRYFYPFYICLYPLAHMHMFCQPFCAIYIGQLVFRSWILLDSILYNLQVEIKEIKDPKSKSFLSIIFSWGKCIFNSWSFSAFQF